MKTVPILDRETYDLVLQVRDKAKWSGTMLPDALNRAGLLWTPDRERQVRAATIRFIMDEMDNWTPAQFLRRRKRNLEGATPQDMYICIYEWIEEHLAHAQTKKDA